MDITRRCDYACRILRAVLENDGVRISVADIAEREGIPYAFARSIQHDLTKAGLVKTARGAHGGLVLAKDPAEVTMLEVLEAMQGPLTVSDCAVDGSCCEKSCSCVYNRVWQGSNALLRAYFGSIVLADLFALGGEHPVVMGALNWTNAFGEAGALGGANALGEMRPFGAVGVPGETNVPGEVNVLGED